MIIRTYTELSRISTFEDRFKYLKLNGVVAKDTFGFDRFMNQMFYQTKEWKQLRNYIIVRDNGCDLGVEGHEIYGQAMIHHLNPITLDDIKDRSDFLLNPEFLVTTILSTHNAIHYGDETLLPKPMIVRTRNDTCPWRH